VWREAAWCHLMFERGLPGAALARLRAVVKEVTWLSPPVGEAVALFALLRQAASAAHPDVFVRPAA